MNNYEEIKLQEPETPFTDPNDPVEPSIPEPAPVEPDPYPVTDPIPAPSPNDPFPAPPEPIPQYPPDVVF
jgi:hypothetical protein